MGLRYQEQTNTVTTEKVDTKKPSLYNVILLNDDFTTQDFVVAILMTIFNKSLEDAEKIMLSVHKNGQGVAGVYSYDIASTKITQVEKIASENEFPLTCRLEKI